MHCPNCTLSWYSCTKYAFKSYFCSLFSKEISDLIISMAYDLVTPKLKKIIFEELIKSE